MVRNVEKLICTRCGEVIRKEQRNCLKCGQLNYANPNNDYMKKYILKDKSEHFIDPSRKVKTLSIYQNKRPMETKANNGNIIIKIFIALVLLIFLFIIFNISRLIRVF